MSVAFTLSSSLSLFSLAVSALFDIRCPSNYRGSSFVRHWSRCLLFLCFGFLFYFLRIFVSDASRNRIFDRDSIAPEVKRGCRAVLGRGFGLFLAFLLFLSIYFSLPRLFRAHLRMTCVSLRLVTSRFTSVARPTSCSNAHSSESPLLDDNPRRRGGYACCSNNSGSSRIIDSADTFMAFRY